MKVRPLDAYGALAYLRTRPDVKPDAIALLGWSNGGSATLSSMSASTPALSQPSVETGFRGALAFYPACGLKGQFETGYKPYAPVRILSGPLTRRCLRSDAKAWLSRASPRAATSKLPYIRAPRTILTIPAESALALRQTQQRKKTQFRRHFSFLASVCVSLSPSNEGLSMVPKIFGVGCFKPRVTEHQKCGDRLSRLPRDCPETRIGSNG